MARDRSKKEPTAGMRKAIAKAEKHSWDQRTELPDGSGGYRLAATHVSNTIGRPDKKRPVVEALSNVTGEIRTYPTHGSNRRFARSVAGAESRGKAFIEASANNDQGKLRGLYT